MQNTQENSAKLLRYIYELSSGDTSQIISRKHLGERLSLSAQDTKDALRLLTQRGMIRYILFGSLCITHVGVVEAQHMLTSDLDNAVGRPDDLERLITKHTRRLQKLREQQAVYGKSVDPRIEIEIEDIEATIKQLHAQQKRSNI